VERFPVGVEVMLRLFTGVFAWFWVAVVLAEVINNAFSLDRKLSVWLFGGGFSLLFLGYEAVNRFIEKNGANRGNQTRLVRFISAYNLSIGIVCLIFMAIIPFLWWGVIKMLARVP